MFSEMATSTSVTRVPSDFHRLSARPNSRCSSSVCASTARLAASIRLFSSFIVVELGVPAGRAPAGAEAMAGLRARFLRARHGGARRSRAFLVTLGLGRAELFLQRVGVGAFLQLPHHLLHVAVDL